MWMHTHIYISLECGTYICVYFNVNVTPCGKTDGSMYNEMCQKKSLHMVSVIRKTKCEQLSIKQLIIFH